MANVKKQAFQLILFLGVISLLGDIIYEGARGVSGQYLNVLGVKAATVGIVVGLGEFLGYAFRLASGVLADKTKAYWFFTILGYGLLISIPLISLSGAWQIVAVLIILERIGKGIRTPARDTIASYGAKNIGTGYGFGIAEFIDQIGAIIGPLIFAFVFVGIPSSQNVIGIYQRGFGLFWLPYLLLLIMLFVTYTRFKKPEELEIALGENVHDGKLPKSFWLYALFVFITTAGFVSFALVGFHLKNLGIMNDAAIAFLYAVAMAIDAIVGLISGKMYDRLKTKAKDNHAGLFVLLAIPVLSALVPFFVFSKTVALIILGVILIGFVLGMQETILKAAVADMTPIRTRSTSYGLFHISFGLAFFMGSSLAGFLYDYSIVILIGTLAVIEVAAIPVFYNMMKTRGV